MAEREEQIIKEIKRDYDTFMNAKYISEDERMIKIKQTMECGTLNLLFPEVSNQVFVDDPRYFSRT